MYKEGKSYGSFPDAVESMGRDPPPDAATSAEMSTAPHIGLFSKALVFELFRVNQFIVIETG